MKGDYRRSIFTEAYSHDLPVLTIFNFMADVEGILRSCRLLGAASVPLIAGKNRYLVAPRGIKLGLVVAEKAGPTQKQEKWSGGREKS